MNALKRESQSMRTMDALESEMTTWRASKVETVSIGSLKVDEGLQPRNIRLVPLKEQNRVERDLAKHVETMTAALRGDPLKELEPLLAAKIDGTLYIGDGHHRLKAYKQAGRKQIPVRIKVTTRRHAAALSAFVNLDPKMPEHPEQKSEKAWQFLASLLGRGQHELRDFGLSTRSVGGKFGRSHETIATMCAKLQATNEKLMAAYFPPAWCDPVTGWPRWREARSVNGRDQWADVDPDVKRRVEIERCARAIAKTKEKFSSEVYAQAEALLAQQDAERDSEDKQDAVVVDWET